MEQDQSKEAIQLLREYRDFVDELQHILYDNAADDEDLDNKIAELKRRANSILGEPLEEGTIFPFASFLRRGVTQDSKDNEE